PDAGVGLWVLEEFVPHGYALAQISTFGTGKSTHCQDVKGLGEQIGIQEAVHWLGEQEWSNGNVGLMGKSYAGTTNWEAAQNPSEHLKTIVPISGSIGVQQMFYRNGSSEARAMLYDVLYEGATTDATSDDMRFCTDDAIGPLSPFTTWLGAGLGGDEWNDYWDERYHLQDVIDNYNGSVYIVWGLQDWNVDPYHAFPTHQLLKDAGINVRTISGQWGHNYPDQPSVHEGLESGYGAEAFPSVTRMDWAVELFPWFEYYLKDIGEEPESYVQVQRNDGNWHIEETWPAEDTVNIQYAIADWDGGMSGTVNSQQSMTITSQPLTEDTHISGLPTLHIDARTNTCNGGQLFVTMFDGTSGLRLGHATMDVRYRDGGYDAKPTSPMTSYRMLMEFNPMDVIIPEGHTIQLVVTETGEDYLPSPCATLGMTIFAGYQVLTLPTLDRPNDHKNWFNVPAWWEE
ncbi:MAG: CocE/NonD family hydrolase, partial [Euryarchaeota archaeon]|nr:CocE/NonD family hydrolase [Euryarchaeota archaeon]MBT5639503.1 CocE/NonD family hydrolase [Euryarchaeota archaeon]MBT6909448.1 CocE/NonD family hydrolase [Euryarchaeota archaeon]